MKRTRILQVLAALLAASILTAAPASAQRRKAKKNLLDGTTITLKTGAPALPMEQRLTALSPFGLGNFAPTKTVFLYPLGEEGGKGIVENGVAVTGGPMWESAVQGPEIPLPGGFMLNVTDSARVDLYLPPECNGQMVVCCPGGGYAGLSTWGEGAYMAKWLWDRGIACAVLKYRMPGGRWEVPLQDVQNALRYCRFHAAEWGVRQIGVAGFSAGGHLASCAETLFTSEETRPDFAILCYPVISFGEAFGDFETRDNLIGAPERWDGRRNGTGSVDAIFTMRNTWKSLVEDYSTQNNVTAQTPPTFIATSTDDNDVDVENAICFYRALKQNGVSAELHIYPYGGHGWSFTDPAIGLDPGTFQDNLGACRPEFSDELDRWLALQRNDRERLAILPGAPRIDETKPRESVRLYPEGQRSDKGIDGITLGPVASNGVTGPEVYDRQNGVLFNVGDSVRFDLYLPERPVGKMVIVLPGGGYAFTSARHEGETVAWWLCSQGIGAAVLNYRMPNGHLEIPLADVQNTFRWCRAHAAEWDVEQIGILGFSAGGHLAATASTFYTDPLTRPDFAVLIYPVTSCVDGVGHEMSTSNMIGERAAWAGNKAGRDAAVAGHTPYLQVASDTPPTFLAFCTDDDMVPPENELRYYEALHRNGVPCELHAFPAGGHGWGFRTEQFGEDPFRDFRYPFFQAMARFLSER